MSSIGYTLINPEPCSSTVASPNGTAKSCNDCFTCAGVREGFFWSSNAAVPATCGVAIEVPDKVMCLSSTHSLSCKKSPSCEEQMLTPGATISGFKIVSLFQIIGPLELKEAIESLQYELTPICAGWQEAPTVIAFLAVPGER